ncbi:Amino acid kinase family protein [Zea mays]|uniref:Amino acid kinase family protein n=1 Tax=Zea mays TaxID=4577 RepID=A0A1D6DVS3_MAIZE|nr:Amino acid kinase family protein [Zea mays]
MSPFACWWSTQQRKLASANASQIIQSLHAGFVPILEKLSKGKDVEKFSSPYPFFCGSFWHWVLHGDAVLDELLVNFQIKACCVVV